MCGVDAATIITTGPDRVMYELYSKKMDAAFYSIRLRIQAVKNSLKLSRTCGGTQLNRFQEQVQYIQQRMKIKFDECQKIHKTGAKHDIQEENKVNEFKEKYAKNWIMACFTSSKKFVFNALEEIQLICKDWSLTWAIFLFRELN